MKDEASMNARAVYAGRLITIDGTAWHTLASLGGLEQALTVILLQVPPRNGYRPNFYSYLDFRIDSDLKKEVFF